MKNSINWIARGGLVTVLAVFAVGCGSGLRSGGSASNSSDSASMNDNITRAQQASADAQQAMADANSAIASISDANGHLKLSAFQSSGAAVQSQGLLAPLVAKLQPIFDAVYNKVLAAKQQFDSAKAALAAAIAKLPAGDPQIAALQAQLDQVTSMETQFETQVHTLASKLGVISSQLDTWVAMATSLIPIPGLGTIAGVLIDMYVLDDVKTLFTDLETKLMAL